MTLPAPITGMRAAFVFMTRIPVGGFPYRPTDWQWAPAHFPLVGLVVGALGGLILWLALPLGPFVAATCAVLSTVYVTGAFHEDGLADTADALGGAHSRKKLHDILKDSRIGTYGACAIGFSLLLRVLLLAEHTDQGRLLAALTLVLVHGLSRVGPVILMAALPYVAGEGAKGSSVAQGGSWSRAAVASAWGGLTLLIGHHFGFSASLLGAFALITLAITTLAGAKFKKRAGGYTGDFLGATEQILELSLLGTSLFLARFSGWDTWLH